MLTKTLWWNDHTSFASSSSIICMIVVPMIFDLAGSKCEIETEWIIEAKLVKCYTLSWLKWSECKITVEFTLKFVMDKILLLHVMKFKRMSQVLVEKLIFGQLIFDLADFLFQEVNVWSLWNRHWMDLLEAKEAICYTLSWSKWTKWKITLKFEIKFVNDEMLMS